MEIMRVEDTVVVYSKVMKGEAIGLGQSIKTAETVDKSSAESKIDNENNRRGIANGSKNMSMTL